MAEVKRGLLEEESIKSIGTEERKVIFASSLGTVFEWYDFYLYATLAPFFAALFFPAGNETAALMSAFATYAAGFLVRPDRKSTLLNSSHLGISYAVFCLKKKTNIL